ncbi:MAG: S-layer homology domain-containing protein [Tissierellia bacterium]|nr:S-layer homology domain-containing protein [Tissierellia bacterium]
MCNYRKRLNKTVSLLLVLIFIMSAIPSYAASFKDVPSNYWAKEYIDKMSKANIVGGYPDGTFRPQNDVSREQSLAFISRLINPTSDEKAKAKTTYSKLFKDLNINDDWKVDAISVCLDRGVITESELRKMGKAGLSKPAQKIEVTEYLVKGMGLGQKANEKSIIVLPFNDAMSIEKTKDKYVYVLLEIGVVDKKGDGEGYFRPTSTIKRDVMVKMLSTSYDYIMKNPIESEEPKSDTDLKDDIEKYEGKIKYLYPNNYRLTLEYEKDKKTYIKNFEIDKDAKIYLDDKSIKLSELKEGDMVEIKCKNEKIYEIDAESKKKEIEGILKNIREDTKKEDPIFYLTVLDSDDISHRYQVSSEARIRRNNRRASVEDLRVKDKIYMEVEYDEIIDIEAKAIEKEVTGLVTKVLMRLNESTEIVVKDLDTKKEETFVLGKDVSVKINRRKANSYEIRPGYYVEMEVEGDEITRIYADSKSVESNIMGRIKSIDYRREKMVVNLIDINLDDLYGEEITVYIEDDTIIVDSRFNELDFDYLSRDDVINIKGSYDGSVFIANRIIIE